jgi:hypothetical protein
MSAKNRIFGLLLPPMLATVKFWLTPPPKNISIFKNYFGPTLSFFEIFEKNKGEQVMSVRTNFFLPYFFTGPVKRRCLEMSNQGWP